MIIVFGSMNIDLVMPVDHFPKKGETVMCATDYLSRPGGKGANQAIAACRAGAKVAMVGMVGDDAFGRRSVNNLKTQGIWTTGIGISDRPTGCATIAVDKKGAHKETFDVLARAKKGGATTILNAAPAGAIPAEAIANIDYLIVNEVEAQQLGESLGFSEETPEAIARKVDALGNIACIITLEENGVVAAKGGELYKTGVLPVEVVDSTGAGDAFCGFFAASLQMGSPWVNALHFASVGAGLSCLGLGAQAGMPAYDDIQAHLKDLPAPEKIG